MGLERERGSLGRPVGSLGKRKYLVVECSFVALTFDACQKMYLMREEWLLGPGIHYAVQP